MNKAILSLLVIFVIFAGIHLNAALPRGFEFKSMSFGVGLFSLDDKYPGSNV